MSLWLGHCGILFNLSWQYLTYPGTLVVSAILIQDNLKYKPDIFTYLDRFIPSTIIKFQPIHFSTFCCWDILLNKNSIACPNRTINLPRKISTDSLRVSKKYSSSLLVSPPYYFGMVHSSQHIYVIHTDWTVIIVRLYWDNNICTALY